MRRLTDSQVLFAYVADLPTSEIATILNVSTHTIRGIKRGTYHNGLVRSVTAGPPGKAKSRRHILSQDDILFIYRFSGTLRDLKQAVGVSKRVAMNIKFRQTYSRVTANEGAPGELRIHKLTWDDVCAIRGSSLSSSVLSQLFFVTVGTINNIKAGRTRALK
jgi:IS30 family transposase